MNLLQLIEILSWKIINAANFSQVGLLINCVHLGGNDSTNHLICFTLP